MSGAPDSSFVFDVGEFLDRPRFGAYRILIFALRRPDILPTGDLGVRAAIKRAYDLAALPGPDEMERIAAPWRPYCSVASWYLWRSLENQGAM